MSEHQVEDCFTKVGEFVKFLSLFRSCSQRKRFLPSIDSSNHKWNLEKGKENNSDVIYKLYINSKSTRRNYISISSLLRS